MDGKFNQGSPCGPRKEGISNGKDISARKSAEMQQAHERLIKQKEISYVELMAQEKERLEIGEELQNNLNQILCAAKLYIELARTDKEHKIEWLERSSDYILDVIEELRTISKKLKMPGMNMGLFGSVHFLVDKLNMAHPIKIEFQVNGIDEEDLDETLQRDIFRMVQELINNTIGHSGATAAMISLTRDKNEITLLVSDNGQGCDLSKAKVGMGILNVISHAELYQSIISTQSSPGKGYEFKAIISLNSRLNTLLHSLSDYDD
jgi:signal transduction histidine kinase